MKKKKNFGSENDLKPMVQYNSLPIKWEELQAKSLLRSSETTPALHASEGADFFQLRIALPDCRRDDLSIIIKGRMVFIKVRPSSFSKEKKSHLQIPVLDRPIILPDNLDPDFTSAEYQNGVLRIFFSKSARPCRNNVEEIYVY